MIDARQEAMNDRREGDDGDGTKAGGGWGDGRLCDEDDDEASGGDGAQLDLSSLE